MADFAGDRLSYIDPQIGEVIEAQVWVSVLPFSSYMYVEAVESQKQHDVAECFQRTIVYKMRLTFDVTSFIFRIYEPKKEKRLVSTPSFYGFIFNQRNRS